MLIQEPKGTALRSYLWVALILFLSLAAYSNSFHGTFQFDDLRTIRFNFSLRDLADWKNIFRTEQSRPLLNATFAINYRLSKLDPFSYHVGNFLIHCFNLILFYTLLHRISSSSVVCMVSTLLMALHPLNTESVTYISSRSILLSSSFYLFGMLLFDTYIRKQSIVSAILFVIVFIAGCIVKEEAAMLPVAALLYNFLFFGSDSLPKHSRFHAGTFLLLLVGSAVRIDLLLQHSVLPFSFSTYIATETKVIWNYLWLAIYPVRLNVDPDISPLQFTGLFFWLFLLLHAGALYFLWKLRRSHPFFTFWGIWFWLNLLLSSVVPLNDFMAEHRVYLSLFGFCACLSYAAIALWMPRTSHRLVVPLILGLVVVFFTVATYQRNRVWQNELTLWLDTVEKSPEKIRPHINLGGAYAQRKLFDLAIAEYRYALLLNPNIAQAYGGLGISYLNRNKLNQAIPYFEKAVQIDPGYADGNIGLGMALYRRQNYKEALTYLLPQYAKRKESVQVVGMIANSYLQTGSYKEAIPFLQKFVQMKPDSKSAQFDLLRAYVYSGLFDEAMKHFYRSRNQFPPWGKKWADLCDFLAEKGKEEDAKIIRESMK